ncbi:MAG: PAS domain S-box protein, partial [Burkholderiales bacterium]|nr:PAS domain S-box protein [Burkholderiales bacterium]
MKAMTPRGEANYRTLVECCPEGVLVHDGQTILFANDALARLVGTRHGGALIGQAVLTLVHGDDRNLILAPASLLPDTAAAPLPVELRLLAADGTTVQVEASGQHLAYEGRPATQLMLRDVSHRRAIERELRDSAERFRNLTYLSSDFYWETDRQHRFTRYIYAPNHTPTQPIGAHIGKARWELPYTQPDEAGWVQHKATLEAHLPFRDFEFSRLNTSGEERYFAISGEPMYGPDDSFIGYRGVGRDITAKKHVEQSLRESETRFRSLSELSADWYWGQDEQYRFTRISTRVGNSVVANPAHLLGKKRWELPGCDPDDPLWNAHRATLDAHRPFRDFEYSKIDSKGNKRWCGVSGYPLLDAAGRFTGYHGFAKDITERRQSRDDLERFRAAVNALPDTIFIVDLHTLRYVDVNDEACRKLGYAREEIIGMPVWMVLAEYSKDQLREQYARLLEHPDQSDLVITRQRRKDGTTFPVEIRRRVVKTASSLLVLGTVRDITERLKGLRALEESEQRFRQLAENAPLVFWLE